jgi:hypothetical protein
MASTFCRLLHVLGSLAMTIILWLPDPARAQYGPGLGQGDLLRQAKEAAAFMRNYRKSHDHLPQLTSEIDDALLQIYKAVNISSPDSTVTVQSSNNLRTYYNLAMAVDPSIQGLSIVNGQVRPPDSWNAPPNTLVILTDGQDQFVIWIAGLNYKPMLDPTSNQPMIIRQDLAPAPH